MKKKILYSFLIIISIFLITGCGTLNKGTNKESPNNINQSNEVISSVKISINDKEYLINLENNETARSFTNLLPLELTMDELNGNEKYIYLDKSLKTDPVKPNHINAGDVMLYGDNCLVIFYKSFDTSYSYTKIGHIDNLPDLGSESVNVKIQN